MKKSLGLCYINFSLPPVLIRQKAQGGTKYPLIHSVENTSPFTASPLQYALDRNAFLINNFPVSLLFTRVLLKLFDISLLQHVCLSYGPGIRHHPFKVASEAPYQ